MNPEPSPPEPETYSVDWKKPAALAATLFVLGSLAYWYEFSFKAKKDKAAEKEKKFFSLQDVPVKKIVVAGTGGEYAFECAELSGGLCKPGDNSKWKLVAPLAVSADTSNVNSLLNAISNLNPTETVSLKDETEQKRADLLKQYKLDSTSRSAKETRRVEITTQKGETHAAYLGETHPVGDAIFTLFAPLGKPDETKVMLVSSYLKNQFTHDLSYWRDKKLMTLASHEVTGFKLRSGGSEIAGVRKDGHWVLTTKEKGRSEELPGDPDGIDSLLSAAIHLNAKNFVSEVKAGPAAEKILSGTKEAVALDLISLRPPAAEPSPKSTAAVEPVVMSTELRLWKRAKPETVYATVSSSDPLYEVETGATGRLDKKIKDLRLSKLMTAMERYAAKRIVFSGAPVVTPVTIESKDGKWAIREPKPNEELNTTKLQELLDRLTSVKIKEFLSGSAIPAGADQGVMMHVEDEKAEKKRELVFWKSGESIYARDMGSKRAEAFKMDADLKQSLPWDRAIFEKAKPAAAATGAPAGAPAGK